MTQLFLASTQFGALTLSAAIDEGAFGPRDQRRVLLTWNLDGAAEAAPALEELPGFAPLRDRFDEVVSLNQLISPQHPGGWTPPGSELPLLERLLRFRLGIEDRISELVVESLGARTAHTLAAIFRGCPITVYSDGLMTYGPTRTPPRQEFTGRVSRLLHLDLVPGLTPMLLSEFGVKAQPLGDAAFVDVAALLPAATTDVPAGAAMIVGQYLSALDVLTPAEEDAMHVRMLRALVAGGHRDVVFKAHPAAGRAHRQALDAAAASLDVRLTVADERDPVEVLFRDRRPSIVVGCFSTALAVAQRFYGIPVATQGGDLVLDRLTPFQNSNRTPATIADAALPRLQDDGTVQAPPTVDLAALVEAVGYVMQPKAYPDLHDAAAAYLAANGSQRYFKQLRLATVGLAPQSLYLRARRHAATVAGSNIRQGYGDLARIRGERLRALVRDASGKRGSSRPPGA